MTTVVSGCFICPGVVMVAKVDLKSTGPKGPCQFESGSGYNGDIY